jgi:hypothetical protein
LDDVKNERPDLLPLRYVVLAHSMGGLTAREYIQGNDYEQDIDKLILFDSPQEGAGSADFGLIMSKGAPTLALNMASQTIEAVGLIAGVILLEKYLPVIAEEATASISMQNAIQEKGSILLEYVEGELPWSIGFLTAWALATRAGNIFGFPEKYEIDKAGGLWYMSLDTRYITSYNLILKELGGTTASEALGKLNLLNSFPAASFAQPMVRIFHHDGLPTIANPRRLYPEFIVREHRPTLKFPEFTDENYWPGIEKKPHDSRPWDLAFNLIPRSVSGPFAQFYWNLDNPSSSLPTSHAAIRERDYRRHSELLSYVGVNITERGTNAVPAWSSKAANVNFFNSPNMDVRRIKYTIDYEMSKRPEESYYKYSENATNLNAYWLDLITYARTACFVANLPWFSPEGANNLCGTVAATSSWVKGGVYATTIFNDLANGTASAISAMTNGSHDFAQLESWQQQTQSQASSHSLVGDGSVPIEKTDLEDFIYEAPYVSVRTLPILVEGVEHIAPMLFYEVSGNKPVGGALTDDWPKEIYDESSLKNVFSEIEHDKLIGDLLPVSWSMSSLDERTLDMQSYGWQTLLGLKKVHHESIKGTENPVLRRSSYAEIPPLIVSKYIREYRFQVDDVRPDLLQKIVINFNFKMDVAWERIAGTDECTRLRRIGQAGVFEKLPEPYTKGACPVDRTGEFVFRPESDGFFEGSELGIGAIQEDGPNTISIITTNKVGMVANQQFTYVFAATKSILQVDWPPANVVLSSLDRVELLASNWNYPLGLSDVTMRINQNAVEPLDGYEEKYSSSMTVLSSDSWAHDVNDKKEYDTHWWLGASDIPVDSWDDGLYWASFQADFFNLLDPQTKQKVNGRTSFILDQKSPLIELEVPLKVLSGDVRTIAHLLQSEDSPDKELWAVGAQVECSESDEVFSTSILRMISSKSAIPLSINGMEGECTLDVWAVDNAVSGKTAWEQRMNLLAKGSNPTYDELADVLLDDGDSFKAGVNGNRAQAKFWVDRTPPTVEKDGVNTIVVGKWKENTPEQWPEFSEPDSPDELLLNDQERLEIVFDICDRSYARSKSVAQALWVAKNKEEEVIRTWSWSGELSSNGAEWLCGEGRIEESFLEQIPDGSYTLHYTLIDEAGNSTGEQQFAKELRVDRTAPEIPMVLAGSMEYANADAVQLAKVHIQQNADIALNRSELSCYRKLDINQSKGEWEFYDIEKKSKDSPVVLEYAMRTDLPEAAEGNWLTYFGCYDAAGNFAYKTDIIQVGKRYPRIISPTSQAGNLVQGDLILIRGIAPNPQIGGSDNEARYRVRWRAVGSIEWQVDGVAIPAQLRDPIEPYLSLRIQPKLADLALWDRSSLDGGVYEIELGVQTCPACEWVTATQTVILDSKDASTEPLPQLVSDVPEQVVPATQNYDFTLGLRNASPGKEYRANLTIRVPASDGVGTVVAHSATTSQLFVSPFTRLPDQVVNTEAEGVYLWQNPDKSWTLTIRPAPPKDGHDPKLVFDFTKEVHWDNWDVGAVNQEDVTHPGENMQGINAMGMVPEMIPVSGISHSVTVLVSKLPLDGVSWTFRTDGAFQFDISGMNKITLPEIGPNTPPAENPAYTPSTFPYFLGGTKITGFAYGTGFYSPQTISFDEERYLWHVEWDGLYNGQYLTGNSEAEWTVVESGTQRVMQQKRSFVLAVAPLQLVTEEQEIGQFVVGLASAESNETETLGDISLRYSLLGSDALVSQKIVNEQGELIRTLQTDVFTKAGSSPNRLHASWNGIDDKGFAVIKPGQYRIVLQAQANGETAKLEHTFALRLAAGLQEAPPLDEQGKGAQLVVEEAQKLENGTWMLEPRPDYYLQADVTARYLPEDHRKVYYTTQWLQGKQDAWGFAPERFSLGVRRHRENFDVVVVALLVGQGGRLLSPNSTTASCGWRSSTWGLFKKKRMTLTKDSESFFELEQKISGRYIIGYDGGAKQYHAMALYMKVFPAGAWETIMLDGETSELESLLIRLSGHEASSLETNPNEHFKRFFDESYRSPLLWGGKSSFKANDNNQIILQDFVKDNMPCSANEEPDGDICGKKTAEDETPEELAIFNPHKKMLTVDVTKGDKGAWSWGNRDICGHSNSHDSFGAKLKIKVNSDYWNPGFGVNNLANRYLRFDPTNISLYGSAGYYNQTDIANYFDGTNWVQAPSLGWINPFEAQQFTMKPHLQNPLLFPDEVGKDGGTPVTPSPTLSKFEARFFTTGTQNKQWIARLDGYSPSKEEWIHQSTFVKQADAKWETLNGENPTIALGINPMSLKIQVARSSTFEAAKQIGQAKVDFPAKEDWLDYFMNSKACPANDAIEEWEAIATGGNMEADCLRFYTGASKVHFYPYDYLVFNYKKWFGIEMEGGWFARNPVTVSLAGMDGIVFIQFANPLNSVPSQLESSRIGSNTSNSGRYDLQPGNVEFNGANAQFNTNLFSELPAISGVEATVSFKSATNGWSLNAAKTHFERELSEYPQQNIYFQRSVNTPKADWEPQELLPGLGKLWNVRDILQDGEILNDPWVNPNSVNMSNVKIMSTDNEPHKEFTASLQEDNLNIKVQRKVAGYRVAEPLTLRGTVPGQGQSWNLSYLRNGSLVSIGSGIQTHSPGVGELPILEYLNANELQGNTSFFLSYGGSAESPVFFRKLDVQIGSLVSGEQALVQSLYRDVSVHFAENSFAQEQFVTVRVVSPDELNFSAFRGLDVIGPVLEILPSYDFSSLPQDEWPRVQVRLAKDEVIGKEITQLRLYKPVVNEGILLPMEKQQWVFLNATGDPLDIICEESPFGDNVCEQPLDWEWVQISAQTSSFSHFAVLDAQQVKQSANTLVVEPVVGSSSARIIRVEAGQSYRLYAHSQPHWPTAANQEQPVLVRQGEAGVWQGTWELPPRPITYLHLRTETDEPLFGAKVQKVELLPATLECAQESDEQLWFGTDNGALYVPVQCNQSVAARMELRTNNYPEIMFTTPIHNEGFLWPASHNIPAHNATGYEGRLQLTGVLGDNKQMATPPVFTDPSRPQLQNTSMHLIDTDEGKALHVQGQIQDEGSGLQRLELSVRLGGMQIMQHQQSITQDGQWQWSAPLGLSLLRSCTGCRLEATITVWDKGANHATVQLVQPKVYPYPEGLWLWYPLTEGAGTQAQELTGNGIPLQLQMQNPWAYGSGLYFTRFNDVASFASGLLPWPDNQEFTLEFEVRPGHQNSQAEYRLLGWDGDGGFAVWVQGTSLILRQGMVDVELPNALPPPKVRSHIALVITEGWVQAYRNGVPMAQARYTNSTPIGMGRLVLGQLQGAAAALGEIKDLRIYTRALSAEDLQEIRRPSTVNGAWQMVRATNLQVVNGNVQKDRSCEIPGQMYLFGNATLRWSPDLPPGSYRIFALARSDVPEGSALHIKSEAYNRQINVPNTGLWESFEVVGEALVINGDNITVDVSLFEGTQLAALALVNDSWADPAYFAWGSPDWHPPQPKVEVGVRYEQSNNWVQPRLTVRNISSTVLSGLQARYVFQGEPVSQVRAQAFYPHDLPIHIVQEANDLGYAQVDMPGVQLQPGQSVYGGNGPHFGLHLQNWAPWGAQDDPSWQPGAQHETLVTDRIEIYDGQGRSLAGSCRETAPQPLRKPAPVVYARDVHFGSNRSSLLHVQLQNQGDAALMGFEIRYYMQLAEGLPPVLQPVYHPHGQSATLHNLGMGQWMVSMTFPQENIPAATALWEGNSIQFEVRLPDWMQAWNGMDDPSQPGPTMAEAPGIVVLDIQGNVLWGTIPQPPPAGDSPPNSLGYLRQDGSTLVVNPPSGGNWTVAVVDPIGITKNIVFQGWLEGSTSLPLPEVLPGDYIVLRLGSHIVDRL